MKCKNNHYHWRIPMINLQVFADGEGDGSGAGDGNEDGTGAGSGDSGNEMSFDDFLGQAENRAEFDRRVQKAVNTAVTKAQEKWQALTDDKLSEAEKMCIRDSLELVEIRMRDRTTGKEHTWGGDTNGEKGTGAVHRRVRADKAVSYTHLEVRS